MTKNAPVTNLAPDCFSISQLCRFFSVSRPVVTKALNAAKVRPAGERLGHPVYQIGESARAILMGPDVDVEDLPPLDRLNLVKAKHAEMRYHAERGEMLSASDVRAQYAAMIKTVAKRLDRMPDILESDMALKPDVVEAIRFLLDDLRAAIYQDLGDD